MKPKIDVDSLRTEHESDEQWAVRRNFMIEHKDSFEQEELVTLAQLFTNIEFLGCRYPPQTMERIAQLSEKVSAKYRDSRKNKLKRTFVQASDAAEQKAKRTFTNVSAETGQEAGTQRQEQTAQKRVAQLERVLLPDAPPRKRQSRVPSPERMPCPLVDRIDRPGSSLRRSGPSQTRTSPSAGRTDRSRSSLDRPGPSQTQTSPSVGRTDHPGSSLNLPGPSQTRTSPSVGLIDRPGSPLDRPGPSQARTSPSVDVTEKSFDILVTELHNMAYSDDDEPNAGDADVTEYEVLAEPSVDRPGSPLDRPGPSQARTSPFLDVTDKSFDQLITELDNMTYSDDDEPNTEEVYDTEPSVLAEPSHFDGMSDFQAEIVEAEDAANDRALREMLGNEDNDLYRFNWSSDRNTLLSARETFNESSGPTFCVNDQTRVTDVFYKMFDVAFVDRIVTETNRYAAQKIALLQKQKKLSSGSRFNRWSPTDRDEMYSFLAVQILQGLYPLAEEELYFRFNGFGTLQYFPKIMSYNRYLLLKAMLHFVDNKSIQTMTKLTKIQPVLDHFNDKLSSLYTPSQEIAIDESLLKWHGRLTFAQKIKSKAAKVGVKTYELCESSSGYLWKFIVYTGKDAEPTTNDRSDGDRPNSDRLDDDRPDSDRLEGDRPDGDRADELATNSSVVRPTNATAKIVFDLMEPLLLRGHTLIMDNFFNSPLLLRCLKRQRTDCYGTLRANREFVPDHIKTLTKPEMRTGEVVTAYCSDLAIFAMRDANIFTMISTFHKLQVGALDKNNKTRYKPTIVLDYNKHMGGIDRKDQFLSAQPMERLRNRVWYKKLFRRLCNVAVFNCFVIFTSYHRRISHRQFRITLAEDLLKRHKLLDLTTEPRLLNSRKRVTEKVSKTTTVAHREMVDSNHFPLPTGSKSTRCTFCKKSRTSWKCEECNVNLCLLVCFKAHHKVTD